MTTIPASTFICEVSLRVRNLESVAGFYGDSLGFRELPSKSNERRLSANGSEPAQIVLLEDRHAAPRPGSAPGLFHTAFLFPSRQALASVLQHLMDAKTRFQGFADHGVSEAIYLADPEGNGVELYCDRPRSTWHLQNDGIAMVTEALDVAGLLLELEHEKAHQLDPATVIGHLHLQVSSLQKSERFYHKILGFDVTQRSYPGALFVSAGGYHHHMGFNTWNSRNSVSLPGTTGLISACIQVPDRTSLGNIAARLNQNGIEIQQAERGSLLVHDFDNIAIRLSVSEQGSSGSFFQQRSQEVEL